MKQKAFALRMVGRKLYYGPGGWNPLPEARLFPSEWDARAYRDANRASRAYPTEIVSVGEKEFRMAFARLA